ncbi:MAG: YceI family protein [Flavobacteriales bacterium]
MKNLKVTKCLCGKTKDENGNCDGSHANKNKYKKNIFRFFLILTTFFSLQSFVVPLDNQVELENAKIIWKGFKVTGSHEGLISIKSGSLIFKNDELIGGDFVVDMTSLTCTDLSGEYKSKLEGHLKSSDFFNTDQFPNSTLKITNVTKINSTSYNVKADLNIKGKSEKIEFVTSVYGNKATSSLKVDRTKYGIKYGSGSFFDSLGDNMIYDEFELTIEVQF